ncbi:MAG: flagellar biosynthetic protein FliO [Ilumatobacteraceae bacterium]
MIRLLVATLLLAAIAVTVRLKARGTGPTRSIKVSARAAVNRGAVVAIIEAEGRRLLIGAAANQVNILADLGSAATSAAAGESGEIVDVEPAPAAPSWLITRRHVGSSAQSRADSFVQRVRQLTVRTADPTLRPRLADALREETRRAL